MEITARKLQNTKNQKRPPDIFNIAMHSVRTDWNFMKRAHTFLTILNKPLCGILSPSGKKNTVNRNKVMLSF